MVSRDCTGHSRECPTAPLATGSSEQRIEADTAASSDEHQASSTGRLRDTICTSQDPPALHAEQQQPWLDPTSSLFDITEDERELALEIREAIQSLPDLDNVTDFMAVHLAIASKGDLTWALDRAYKMQQVRQEYKITTPLNYSQGVKSMRDVMLDVVPGYLLSYTYNLQNGTNTLVADLTARHAKEALRDFRKMDQLGRGIHYTCYATFPSFSSVREGNVHIMECDGFAAGLGMADVGVFSTITNLSHGTFPSVVKTKFYNTPTMLNVLVAMAKRNIPKEVSSKFELGCTFIGGRLDQYYMVPTPEIATQRALDSLCESLQIRLESEKVFSLDGMHDETRRD